jgi:hypothetical protein
MRVARLIALACALQAGLRLLAQSAAPAPVAAAPQTASPDKSAAPRPVSDVHAIAIVPLDSKIPGYASEVTGDLQVFAGRAFIAANAAVTAGDQTTRVMLPNRGTLLVCTLTTVKLTADSGVHGGEVPGLLMAMDHGAVEMSFATSRNSDSLLTPDFRILISGPGAAEVKVRLGPQGDTCVDNAAADAGGISSALGMNAAANGPYVLVSSVFDGGAYRVQPGQRVMFQHGSLHEVVDQEKESCGCPPAQPNGNEFPVAQSEGLAPMPEPAALPPDQNSTSTVPVAPLVYKAADHAPQPSAEQTASAQPASPAATQPKTQKKPGFFTRLGHFFRRIFGAE